MGKDRNLTKDFIIVVFVVVFGKVLGFGRELVISYLYGSSYITDAFYYVNSLITASFSIITMGLAQAFMPIYTDSLICNGKAYAKKFADKIILILFTISLILSIILCVFPTFVISIFAPDLSNETQQLASLMLRIMTWTIPIYTIFSIRKCILNANKNYVITEASGIPYSLCLVVFSLAFYKVSGTLALTFAALIGVVCQYIFTYFFSKKHYRFSININFREDDTLKKYFSMLLPIALSALLEEANGLIRKSLAGGLGEGSIANLNYCMTLTTLVNGIVITSITTVYFPHMIESFSSKNYQMFKKHSNDCISLSSFVLLPLVAFLYICSYDVVKAIYERGAFSSNDTKIVASLFSIYIIGSIVYLYRSIIKTAFFSIKDAKTPMINEIIYLVICITANILQIKVFHQNLSSLGISWVLAITLVTPVMFIQFKKKQFSIISHDSIIEIIKCCFGAFLVILSLILFNHFVNIELNVFLGLFIKFGLAFVIYITFMFLVKSENIYKTLRLFGGKKSEQKSND